MFLLSFLFLFLGNSLQKSHINEKPHEGFEMLLDSRISIENSEYNANKPSFEPLTSGSYLIQNCTFTSNTGSDTTPGAILISDNADVKIKNCTFQSNTGESNGGAISVAVVNIEISDSIFIKNSVDNNKGTSYRYQARGGAIYFIKLAGTQSIKSCTFIDDKAKTAGGAIFFEFSTSHSGGSAFKDPINIIDCQFTGCEAGTSGGAITSGYITDTGSASADGDMQIQGCTFTRCDAEGGGAINFLDGTTTGDEQKIIHNCIFDDNLATTEGSCIRSLTYELTINNVTFKNNKRAKNGKVPSFLYIQMNEKKTPIINSTIFEANDDSTIAILLRDEAKGEKVNFIDCKFRDYTSGQVFNSDRIESNPTTFINCQFTNLSAKDNKNPITLSSNAFNFTQCTFSENKKGVITITGESSVSFNDCDFNNNQIDTNGAALQISESKGEISLTSCRFTENTAKSFGGCIYCTKANQLKLTDCKFNKNIARRNGGCLYFIGEKFDLADCEFKENTATNDDDDYDSKSRGGSLFLRITAGSTIEGCKFDTSNAKSAGGAIFVEYSHNEGNKCTLRNCYFYNCTSGQEGGAVSSGYSSGSGAEKDGDMLFDNCTFEECQSARGGALYFNDGTTSNVEHKELIECVFIKCSATDESGEGYAIFGRSYQVTLKLCTFKDFVSITHSPGSQTSILYINMNEDGVSPSIESLAFSNNTGVSAMIFKVQSSLTLDNLTFTDVNQISPCISLDSWEVKDGVTIQNSLFRNITDARCITVLGNPEIHAKISRCNFSDNTIYNNEGLGTQYTANSGSCLYFTGGGNFELEHCYFTNDHAGLGGGAIYAETNSIDLNLCTFIECTAIRGGGAYIIQSSKKFADDRK